MFSFIFSVTMASSSHSCMSVLDPSFPDLVRKTLEEGEEDSDANDLHGENDPVYNSEHETAIEQSHDSSESVKLEINIEGNHLVSMAEISISDLLWNLKEM